MERHMMFTSSAPSPDLPKADVYARLCRDLDALFAGERDPIANAANMAALLFHSLPDLNWAGFYILRGSELVLGPFQGKPACVRIPVGRGVCGEAVARRNARRSRCSRLSGPHRLRSRLAVRTCRAASA